MKTNKYFADYSYGLEIKDGVVITERKNHPKKNNGSLPLIKIIKNEKIKILSKGQILDTIVECVETGEIWLTQESMIVECTKDEVEEKRRTRNEFLLTILMSGC